MIILLFAKKNLKQYNMYLFHEKQFFFQCFLKCAYWFYSQVNYAYN